MAQQQPTGGMLRVWNPGSDTSGPPDEVKAFGAYQPTEADLTEGCRDKRDKEDACDAADE